MKFHITVKQKAIRFGLPHRKTEAEDQSTLHIRIVVASFHHQIYPEMVKIIIATYSCNIFCVVKHTELSTTRNCSISYKNESMFLSIVSLLNARRTVLRTKNSPALSGRLIIRTFIRTPPISVSAHFVKPKSKMTSSTRSRRSLGVTPRSIRRLAWKLRCSRTVNVGTAKSVC